MTAPRVSVLLGVHNGARYLGEALVSVLRQTFADFELVVIDDASTDDTPQLLAAMQDPRIRVLRNDQNLGLTKSLNRGLAIARGALIARQDADDRSHPGRLAAQVGFLERHANVVVLGTQGQYIDARGRQTRTAPWPKSGSDLAIRWQLMFDSPFIHSSVMFRTSVVRDELGGYDESFRASQDFELWSRISARGYPMRNLPETLVDFRVHSGSVSTRYSRERLDKLRPLFVQNLERELGASRAPAGWPDSWFQTNFPGAVANSASAVTSTVRAIDRIYQDFVAAHPAASGNSEIRRHLAAMFIRVANHAADSSPARSLTPLMRAGTIDPLLAISAFPRYAAYLGRHAWRGASKQ